MAPDKPRNMRVLQGDILDSECHTLVNTVNTVGVMGKGIALDFRRRFPEMYADYVRRCGRHEVRLGEPYLYTAYGRPWILNFPTKDHWRSAARVADIQTGLEYLVAHARAWKLESIACPPLGCGLGQLEWRVVGRLLYRYLALLDIPVELYAPTGTAAEQMTHGFLATSAPSGSYTARLRPEEVALSEIVRRIDRHPYSWKIGRTSFQKVAYFATQFGLPTGYEFGRAGYGPFTEDVQRLLVRLVNNGLLIESREGSMLRLKPGPSQGDAREAFGLELLPYEPAISRVVDLALRLTPTELEIAATAHFVAARLAATGTRPSEREVYAAVVDWKRKRRPSLDVNDIAQTIRTLNLLGVAELEMSDDLLPDSHLVA